MTPEPTNVSCKCVIGKKDCNCQAFLTDDDETGCLEELLVVPGGVFGLQDVADPVVLPEPQGGVQRQTGDDSKHFLPDGKCFLRRDPGWVVHPDGCVLYSGGVHLAVNDLKVANVFKTIDSTTLTQTCFDQCVELSREQTS